MCKYSATGLFWMDCLAWERAFGVHHLTWMAMSLRGIGPYH